MISNKHAKELLNTSLIDESVVLQQLQNDRLDKIEDIERSLKVDDRERYIRDADRLSSMSYVEDPYGYSIKSTKNKYYGETTEFVKNSAKMNNSFDSRKRSENPYLRLDFAPKTIPKGRHLDDPFLNTLL
jgi:hypothetical protein